MRTKTKKTADSANASKQASGAQAPPAATQAATIPPQCVTAKVRPEDALWIANRCKTGEKLLPWFVAGVLAEAGEAVLRGQRYNPGHNPENFLHETTANCLWQVINREECNFTETIPVFLPEAEYCLFEDDAESMRRDVGDWLGTLIMMGVRIAEADKNLTFLTYWRGFSMLAHDYERRMEIEAEKPAASSFRSMTIQPTPADIDRWQRLANDSKHPNLAGWVIDAVNQWEQIVSARKPIKEGGKS